MRRFLAVPFLAIVLSAQPQPQMVVSVGHAGRPSLAVFAAGHLAVASWANVALIDLSTGLTVARLPQPGLVTSMAASPGGDVLAVGTCGYSVQLWDVKSRSPLRRIAVRGECPESLSFSPDGALLATSAYECATGGGLQIWDVRSGALKQELARGCGIRSVAFSGDGSWLAGVDDKGKATIFEWPSGRPLRALDGLPGAGAMGSASLASPDGTYLAWLGLHELLLWDVRRGDRIPLPGARPVTITEGQGGTERTRTEWQVPASAAEFLDDGRLAYVDGDRLLVLTLPDGPMGERPLEEPKTDCLGDVCLTLSPSWLAIRGDGRIVAGTNEAETIVWDVAAGRRRDVTSPALTRAGSLAWSPSGVVAWTDLQSGVRAWSDQSGEPVELASSTIVDSAEALAFGPDGGRLVVSDSSSVYVVDVAHGRPVSSLEVAPTTRTGVAFSPDGSRVAFEGPEGLALFDDRLDRQTVLARLERHVSAEYVAFSPDGRWVAAGLGGPRPSVKVWPATEPGDAVTLETMPHLRSSAAGFQQ